MEALWTLPLYFIFPILGIIILISGIIQYNKYQKKTRLIIGLCFLLLPIIHLLAMGFIQDNLEEHIVGEYAIEGKKETLLKINGDGSFELKKSMQFKESGKGKWDIYNWDIVELDLHFKSSQESEVSFEIIEDGNEIQLSSNPFNTSRPVLIKK